VAADHADEAVDYVTTEYEKEQPELVSHIPHDKRVLVCEPDGSARIVFFEI
jgi:galacturonokinase